MDRRVTPPERITSPTWGPPPPCKQALSQVFARQCFSAVLHKVKKTNYAPYTI